MKKGTQWLLVECAPGRLRDGIDFSSERELLRESARLADGTLETLIDPDREQLTTALSAVKTGGVVHFSGFDPHQGLQLLGDSNAEKTLDGVLVRSLRGAPETHRTTGTTTKTPTASNRAEAMGSWDVARLLTAGGRSPQLVAFNIYNSASRTAAACVALGAQASIGFQDAFDDSQAELFFATFYPAWKLADWNTAAAFRYAWQFVRAQKAALHGSGIVLWSAPSIRETLPGYWQGRAAPTLAIRPSWILNAAVIFQSSKCATASARTSMKR